MRPDVYVTSYGDQSHSAISGPYTGASRLGDGFGFGRVRRTNCLTPEYEPANPSSRSVSNTRCAVMSGYLRKSSSTRGAQASTFVERGARFAGVGSAECPSVRAAACSRMISLTVLRLTPSVRATARRLIPCPVRTTV